VFVVLGSEMSKMVFSPLFFPRMETSRPATIALFFGGVSAGIAPDMLRIDTS